MHLYTPWTLLVNRWGLMLLIFCTIVGLGAGWTISQIPLYTASTTLIVEPAAAKPGAATEARGQDDYYQQQVSFLRSHALAATVIMKGGLEPSPDFTEVGRGYRGPMYFASRLLGHLLVPLTHTSHILGIRPRSPEEILLDDGSMVRPPPAIVSGYLDLLTVIPEKHTREIKVQFTTTDPKLSQELAEAHVATFMRTTQTTRFTLTAEARTFLEKEIARLAARRSAANSALQKFHREHPEQQDTTNESLLANRILDILSRLTQATIRRIDAAALSLLTEKKEPKKLSGLIANDWINRLNTLVAKLETERTQLAGVSSRSHSRLDELNKQIADTSQRIENEMSLLLTQIRAEYTTALETEQFLQKEVKQHRQTAVERKDHQATYTLLKAEIESLQTISERIRSWLSKSSIEITLPSYVRIAEPAVLPLTASSPHTSRNLLLSLTCGIFAAVGFAYYFERLDTRVRTLQDVWQTTSYPLVGAIPPMTHFPQTLVRRGRQLYFFLRNSLAHRSSVNIFSLPLSAELILAHATWAKWYILLCSSLFPANKKRPPKIVLFTAAQPKDGTTVTTVNLAITLAQSGRTVVIVDTKLSNGRCHELLHCSQNPGLGDVLHAGAALPPPRRRTKKHAAEESVTTGEETVENQPAASTHRKRPSRKLTMLVEKVLQQTGIVGLSVLAGGRSLSDSSALLASSVMKEVLTILCRRFDFVFLDSFPATSRADTIALSQISDATFLIIRGCWTKREAARAVAEQLHYAQAPVLGVILNEVHPNALKKSAGHLS